MLKVEKTCICCLWLLKSLFYIFGINYLNHILLCLASFHCYCGSFAVIKVVARDIHIECSKQFK